VSRVQDHEMYISLPGRTGGTVSITNISTPYVQTLEKYASGKGGVEDDVSLSSPIFFKDMVIMSRKAFIYGFFVI